MLLDKKTLRKLVWFLDYDGSLCPHQEVWETRSYDPKQILDLLKILANQSAVVLWNTGRRVESLGGISTEFLDYSGYFVQGTFFWDASKREATCLSPALPAQIAPQVTSYLQSVRDYRLEIKPTSLRIAPHQIASVNGLPKILAELKQFLPEGWEWILGHRGAELLPKTFSKGSALRTSIDRLPAGSIPIAVGDDILDRPAIEESILRGGYAVLVGENCGWITEVPHQPDQIIFCETPAAVHAWARDLAT